ncbi:MAG: hypothetical protein ABIH70_02530 [Chloroflexota bacterium]
MGTPLWLARARKIFWWPMLIIGGIFSAGGVYLTGRDFILLNWPGWLWLTIGVFIFVISITGILYQFQRQSDSIAAIAQTGQKEQTSNLPERPHYKKTHKIKAKEFIDEYIKIGEELKSRIIPNSLSNMDEIRSETAKFVNDAENEIWKVLPEYSEFFKSILALPNVQYLYWYHETAAEAKKIDDVLFKLKQIRLQL